MGYTSLQRNFTGTQRISVQNIIVDTHKATKFSRVYQMKNLLDVSESNTRFEGNISRHIVHFKKTIINASAKIIKNVKPQGR